jgi:hypothetical protein
MRNLTTAHHAWGSVTPPEPHEVAVAGVRWRRTGFLQRLERLDRDAQMLAAEDPQPTEKPAARRAA